MSRSRSSARAGSFAGTVRVHRDPRVLARVLKKGHVAIIDRADLDAVSAEALAARQPVCVVNASPSLSGRVQARGAQRLLALGVPLFDASDRAVLGLADGVNALIERGDDDRSTLSAEGHEFGLTELTSESIDAAMEQASRGASLRVPELAAGALDLLHRDGTALVDGAAVRGLDLDLTGKDVLVVTAGAGFDKQVAALRTAVRELKMTVIATGDAANTVAAHHRVDVIVGPFDGVADEVLARAHRVVVHGESHAVASTRLGSLGVRYVSSESRLEPEDLAVSIAASAGARLIATVGIEASLAEAVESPRGASALLARFAAGPAWIDGAMLARLYRSRWSRAQSWMMVVVAAAAVAAALALHPSVRDAIDSLVGRA